jgi:lysophospholipase L1-like esterase
MIRPLRPLVAVAVVLQFVVALESRAAESLQLTLPPVCYAVAGQEMNIYFDNVVLTPTPEKYQFRVQCAIGRPEARRWTVTPGTKDVGDHPITVTVVDESGKVLQEACSTLHVAPADAGAGRNLSLLIVGDSLTSATVYPNEIARLLSLPGNPTWTMLGTHRPKHASPGVGHEGYGGWTWARFATHLEPKPDGSLKKRSSPFVFAGKDGKPVLDLERYFTESLGGQRPDVVTIMLGINDCFSAPPDDPKAIDARIDAMFAQAETLLAAFRKALPQAELGICLTTPPNARESGFEANYQGKYHRWGWKTIQHRLVQRQLEHFANRQSEHIFLIPTELNLDPVDGYPVDNGVHPNAFGYKQIGASIFAWIKSRLEAAKP